MNVGSLFSGIGGFDLGLERAGMRVLWQCEADEFCRRVLAKHWPGITCYENVCELRTPPAVDLLCGGFPCQDISQAGRGVGIAGSRSGLWSEFARLIGELRPRYVVVENVPVLRSKGLDRVLQDLAALGYDAEWDCLPAKAAGAPHRRDRIWLVAYPQSGLGRRLADTDRKRGAVGRETGHLARASRTSEGIGAERQRGRDAADDCRADLARFEHQWAVEPNVGRLVDGVPDWLDRLGALGNALVPQVAEWIGRRIIAYEEGRLAA